MRLLLVRHTEVVPAWRGRCYGRSEAPLSSEGRRSARDVVRTLDIAPGTTVHASPLRRARFLGALVAARAGIELRMCPALAERDFGTWEGRDWDAIHAETGEAMMGMVERPETFRPGGGETTRELATRVLDWASALPRDRPVIAVTHGGPIAVLAGTARGLPERAWPSLVPSVGGTVGLELGAGFLHLPDG